jgi:hypothetical protein
MDNEPIEDTQRPKESITLELDGSRPYHSLEDIVEAIGGTEAHYLGLLLHDFRPKIRVAPGSSHNHQAWVGGYEDHIVECCNIARLQYAALSQATGRALPFTLRDALLVLFFHDFEKPWKRECNFQGKQERHIFRAQMIGYYAIHLTTQQLNALKYAEGEGDDYSGQRRVMNELAAFVHSCDVLSARLWHDRPLAEGESFGPGRSALWKQ